MSRQHRATKAFSPTYGALRRILIRVLFVVGVARAALCPLHGHGPRSVGEGSYRNRGFGGANGVGGKSREPLPARRFLPESALRAGLLTQSGFSSQVELALPRMTTAVLGLMHGWFARARVVLGGRQPNHSIP